MTNRSNEPVPGGRVTAAPMMHSMDFLPAMVAPDNSSFHVVGTIFDRV